jgi:flagellar protein FliO/FliZ
MLIVLALIAGAAFGLTKFFKRGLTSGYTSDPYLKRAASLTLAPGKTVHVITLDETAFVVGVTESAVTPIGQVQNKDLVDALNLHAEESAPPQNRRSFADLLGALTGRGGRNQRGESGAFEDTARAIREQKDRISRVQGGEG